MVLLYPAVGLSIFGILTIAMAVYWIQSGDELFGTGLGVAGVTLLGLGRVAGYLAVLSLPVRQVRKAEKRALKQTQSRSGHDRRQEPSPFSR